MSDPRSRPEHLDVLIIGAGLSGIGAAAHLVDAFPERRYAILEARGAIGGTWDLFRYRGVRCERGIDGHIRFATASRARSGRPTNVAGPSRSSATGPPRR